MKTKTVLQQELCEMDALLACKNTLIAKKESRGIIMTTQIKERPIIFSSEMARALLDGRKTQTRRIVKTPKGYLRPIKDGNLEIESRLINGKKVGWPIGIYQKTGCLGLFLCPYGVPGDRLWVRETAFIWRDLKGRMAYGDGGPVYSDEPEFNEIKFDGVILEGYGHTNGWKKIRSIFMPRWASRITLEVVSVRVENDLVISLEDANSEGFDSPESFIKYWDKLNNERGYPWKSKPLRWVLGFRIVSN